METNKLITLVAVIVIALTELMAFILAAIYGVKDTKGIKFCGHNISFD